MSMSNPCCSSCYYGYHRSDHDLRLYGSYSHNYECMYEGERYPVYKQCDDHCEHYMEKERKKHK